MALPPWLGSRKVLVLLMVPWLFLFALISSCLLFSCPQRAGRGACENPGLSVCVFIFFAEEIMLTGWTNQVTSWIGAKKNAQESSPQDGAAVPVPEEATPPPADAEAAAQPAGTLVRALFTRFGHR